jgi:hypothetical protein
METRSRHEPITLVENEISFRYLIDKELSTRKISY